MSPWETIVSRVPAGKYFYSNTFGRHFLLALEAGVGKNGMAAVLNLAGLPQLINNYPADNPEREFDIACFATINAGCDDMGRSFMIHRQAGKRMGLAMLEWHPKLAGFNDEAFKNLPLHSQLQLAVPALMAIISDHDPESAEMTPRANTYEISLATCPGCYGRKAEDYEIGKKLKDKPICHGICGLIEGMLQGVTGESLKVVELQCAAFGHERCVFQIPREPTPKN